MTTNSVLFDRYIYRVLKYVVKHGFIYPKRLHSLETCLRERHLKLVDKKEKKRML